MNLKNVIEISGNYYRCDYSLLSTLTTLYNYELSICKTPASDIMKVITGYDAVPDILMTYWLTIELWGAETTLFNGLITLIYHY